MILSYDLNKDYFDNDALADALSRLARSHPSASIRVLLINNQLLSRSSHRLLNLYHRLPSSIQFRVLADENIELIREGWVVADRAGVLGFPIDGNGTSWSDFNNRPLANDYIELFNRYWHTATEDPSLRSIIL